MIDVVKTLSGNNCEAIENFVLHHSRGNFFQSTKAFQFFKAVDNYDPLFIVARDGQEIVGSLLAVVIRESGRVKGFFSKRCVVWGGPLVKEGNLKICENLLSAFNDAIRRKAIYSQFRNFYDVSAFKGGFNAQGWYYEDHLNIIIDLSKTEEQLWKEVHSKRRNMIRRARKEGTRFKLLENRDEIKISYDIIKEVYDRAKLPLPGAGFFKTAYDLLAPEQFKIFLAINENRIIGTMYVLCFQDTMYDWYAGSYQAYYKKCPNDLIPWEVFLWGKENGFKTFDFGGAGKPDVPYGVRDYKKKFGGVFVNYGRFENIHKRVMFQAGKLGLKVLQRLK